VRVISHSLGQASKPNVGASIAAANPFAAIWNTVTGASQQGIAQGANTFNNAAAANAASAQYLYASMQPQQSYTPYIFAGLGVLALGVLLVAARK
jgi:hypothetical protein